MFMIRTKFNGYSPDGRRLYYKGGGGSDGVKYDQLEGLYAEQAASARLLRGMAERNLPGVTQSYVDEVNEVLGDGYAERQAGIAESDMASAAAMERNATARELSSMGVNPNDARFTGSMRAVEGANAARTAAGKNAARRDAENKQLAVAQDAVGTFTGQSNSAASQLANTSSGMANMLNQQNSQQMAQQQQRSQNTANAVAGGMMAMSYFKDGGKVCKPGGIKRLEKHAGFLGGSGQVGSQQGFTSFQTPTPPPSMQQQQSQGQSMGNTMLQGGLRAGKMRDAFSAERAAERTDKIGKIAGKFSESGGNQIQSRAAGMRMNGEQAESAAKAYESAAGEAGDAAAKQSYLDSAANIRAGAGLDGTATAGGTEAAAGTEAAGAAGTSGAEVAGAEAAGAAGAEAAGAEAAGAAATEAAGAAATAAAGAAGAEAAGAAAAEAAAAAAAETAAATTAASSGLGTAAAAVGTAMPWVGAAMAVGSLLGAFKDGGEVKSIPMLANGGGIDIQGLADYSHLGAGGLTNWLQGKEKPDDSNKERLLSMSGDVIGMKLFNEGGNVEGKPVQDKRSDGGQVDGEWEGNTDTVPALLTEGEHVITAEASALIGHDKLDKINEEGLKLREKGWTPPKIRAAGLGLKRGVV